MKTVRRFSTVLAGLLALGWLGLQLKPRPFAAYSRRRPLLAYLPIPTGLPAPVTRYYRTIAGQHIPRISSAVITGRGSLRFGRITLPARLRFTHLAGQSYKHYIETTFFGLPLMKVNETFVNGRARLELPVGVVENEPKVDMAANLGLWGESIWLPSIFITDPRIHWEAIDAVTARLLVPFGEDNDSFTVTFDPETGLIDHMTALRYRSATDDEKHLWRLDPLQWERFNGLLIPSRSAVTWVDEGRPWLIIEVEEIIYNVDVSQRIWTRGEN